MKRKFETYPNQFETREDCELYFSSRKAKAEAPEGGECSVECIEDDSEEFNFDEWVEEQKRTIRELEK